MRNGGRGRGLSGIGPSGRTHFRVLPLTPLYFSNNSGAHPAPSTITGDVQAMRAQRRANSLPLAAEPPAAASVANLHFFAAPRARGRARAKAGTMGSGEGESPSAFGRGRPEAPGEGAYPMSRGFLAYLARLGYAASMVPGAMGYPGTLGKTVHEDGGVVERYMYDAYGKVTALEAGGLVGRWR